MLFIGAADEGSEQGGEVGQAAGEGEVAARDRRQGEGREAAGEEKFLRCSPFQCFEKLVTQVQLPYKCTNILK